VRRSVSPKKVTGQFARLPHAAIDDLADLTAIGLLAYLERLPPGKPFSREQACKKFKQGRTAIDHAMDLLQAKGYVHYVKKQLADGKHVTHVYHSITPATFDRSQHPSAHIPTAGKPTVGKQQTDPANVVNFRRSVNQQLKELDVGTRYLERSADIPTGRLPCPRCNGHSPKDCERCDEQGHVAANG